MGNVRIVTDSNAWLPPEIIEQYQISVVPHRIKAGSAYYEEGESFDADDLFAKTKSEGVTGTKNLPVVRAVDLNTFIDCYTSIGEDVDGIVSIHTSSELSPVYDVARHAAEMLKGRHTIRVIDSMTVSFGLGLLVRHAAEAAAQGADVVEIARIINGTVPHLYFTCFTESLNFLERSADLGTSQSLLGTMLGIKAMVIMEDGELQTLEKVQTDEEVLEKLYEYVVEFANVQEVGILHHGKTELHEELYERLCEALPGSQVHQIPYPPSLMSYLGSHMLGVVVFEGANY